MFDWGISMNFNRCEPFDTPCRFCSKETLLVPYVKLTENPKTNRLEPALQTMLRKEPLGDYCNNVSKWCKVVTQCPARNALAFEPWTGQKAEGTGIYSKLHTGAELHWKCRDDGDTRQTVEIVHLGQQTLRRV